MMMMMMIFVTVQLKMMIDENLIFTAIAAILDFSRRTVVIHFFLRFLCVLVLADLWEYTGFCRLDALPVY